MNLLRIFKRLRDLEAETAELKRTVGDATIEAHAIRDQYAASLEAARKQTTDDLASHAAKSLPCGRCGGMMDVLVDREHGPRIVENGKQRAIVCAWCRAALKPRGWALAKLELPVEPPVEIPKEHEATT